MSSYSQFLSGNEIRQKFLDFYAQRGHQILSSASLVPEDPTVLLTIAGMLPFKPIFLGQKTFFIPSDRKKTFFIFLPDKEENRLLKSCLM